MTTRKRNEWLEAGLSEDEDRGYDSEEEQSKGTTLAGRASKRRKPEVDSDAAAASEEDLVDEAEDDEREHEEENENDQSVIDISNVRQPDRSANASAGSPDPHSIDVHTQKTTILKPLTAKQLAASQKAAKRTGVIYLSRIPPFMKPSALRHLLSPYGEINRIFLTPESSTAYSARKRSGGNKKRSFTDGWVEFVHKRDAKLVAKTLNAQIIGGKRGGWYHDDVWNIKYLKGFKWDDLVSQIAGENREREARMRVEIAQGKREAKLFAENVERARVIEGIEAKRRDKGRRRGDDADKDGVETADTAGMADRTGKEFRRQFKQNEVKVRKEKPEQNEEVKRVLSKIF